MVGSLTGVRETRVRGGQLIGDGSVGLVPLPTEAPANVYCADADLFTSTLIHTRLSLLSSETKGVFEVHQTRKVLSVAFSCRIENWQSLLSGCRTKTLTSDAVRFPGIFMVSDVLPLDALTVIRVLTVVWSRATVAPSMQT